MREMHAPDVLALLLGGVLPGVPRLGLRHHGEPPSGLAFHSGRVEAVGDAVELRFDLPRRAKADVMRLALGLVPGRYRIGRLTLGTRVISDLPARHWAASSGGGHDGWIHVSWDVGTSGPELDVRGLLDDDATPVRLAVARLADEGMATRVDTPALLAGVQRMQFPLVGTVATLAQQVDGLSAEVTRQSALLRSGIGEDARIMMQEWERDSTMREDRIRTALESLDARLERMEQDRSNTFWQRVRRRLWGAR